MLHKLEEEFEITNVIVATEGQGTPEWLIARKFKNTGTSAHLLLKKAMTYGKGIEEAPQNRIQKILHVIGACTVVETYTKVSQLRGLKYNEMVQLCQCYLGEMFLSNRTSDFVMGTPMRLVPIISKTTGDNMAKCSKMQACQGTFTAKCRSVRVYTIRVYTIPSLDFRHPTADHFSIRDFLLDVKLP